MKGKKEIPVVIPGGRVPPYSMEAEKAVLGAILLNNKMLAMVMQKIKPEHFYIESLRVLYQAMLSVAENKSAIDPVTVGTHLQANGLLDKVGGPSIFDGLTENISTIENAEHYANIVRSFSAARKVIYSSLKISAEGLNGISVEDVPRYITDARKEITMASTDLTTGAGPQTVDASVVEIYHELETGEEPKGLIKTGVGNIDRVIGGLWPGLLHVVAARPAMGKSAFALNIASNVVQSGKRVLYFTLEDVRKLVTMRMLARYADIDLNDIVLRRVKSPDAWKRFTEAATKISGNKPFWIEDSGGLTSSAIHQMVATHKMAHGADLIIVDHLGEVADEVTENETAMISKAARNFRDVAKEFNLPVLLLHQLNRRVESRDDKRPTLSDLRQSGAIEQIARHVWFLYRPGYYEPDGDEDRSLQLIVAKASHGKTGMLRLWCDLSRMYMREWDTINDGPFFGETNNLHQDARDNARERKKGQSDFFFTGGGVHEPKEKY